MRSVRTAGVGNLFHPCGVLCMAGLMLAGVPFARTIPGPRRDSIVVVRPSRSGSVLERWSAAPMRRLASLTVGRRIADVVPRGGALLLVSAHRLGLLRADLSATPPPLWGTPRTILRAAPWQA